MTAQLMLAIGIICILSVFVNGIMLAIAVQKNQEMIRLYQGMLNLVKHSKIFGRRMK